MGFKRRARVLFICAHNNARAPMAEAWARALGDAWVEARSAGTEPTVPHPLAIAAMAESGIDIAQQQSRTLTPELIEWADLLVTVCAKAERQCPLLPAHTQKKHWPTPDPVANAGNDVHRLNAMRTARDDLRRRVEGLIGGLKMLARADSGGAPPQNR